MSDKQKAVNFIKCIQELALAMGLNVFVVTDGARDIEALLNEYVKLQKNKNISF